MHAAYQLDKSAIWQSGSTITLAALETGVVLRDSGDLT